MVANSIESDTEHIKFGVPQGSILGPILFLLYINDIVAIPHTPDIVLYADDTSVFFSSRDLSSLIPVTNAWLKNLSKWLDANQLLLNVNKTKYIVFSSINRPVNLTTEIVFQSRSLERVTEYKFLGIHFHENLRWTCHVNFVKRDIAQSIGMLNRFRALLPMWLKRQLYFTTVHSRLHYCLLVWGVTSKCNMTSLYLMQKKSIRFIENLSSRDHTFQYFEKHRILNIEALYNQRLSEVIFSQVKTDRELFLSTYTNTDTHYNFRNTNFIKIRTRTNYGTQLLSWQIPNLLNLHPGLIDIIDHNSNLLTFRKKSKTIFFTFRIILWSSKLCVQM